MMPEVTVKVRLLPSGLPTASTHSPTRARLTLAQLRRRKPGGVDLHDRHVGQRVGADHLGLELAMVEQLDRDPVGAFDHVGVGEDVAVGASR